MQPANLPAADAPPDFSKKIFAELATGGGTRELPVRLPPADGLRGFLADTAGTLPVSRRCHSALLRASDVAAGQVVPEDRPSELLDMVSLLNAREPHLDLIAEAKFYPVCSNFIIDILKFSDQLFNEGRSLALTHEFQVNDAARRDLSTESGSCSKRKEETRPRPGVLVCLRQIAVLLGALKVRSLHEMGDIGDI